MKKPTITIFKNLLKFYAIVIALIASSVFQCSGNIIVLNGLTHENTCEAGQKYRETIEIQNTGGSEKSVKIYLRDYWFSHTGQSKHDPAGTMLRSNASWITHNPELVTLSPNEKTTINFEVATPNSDSLTGTYWSVIMVEGITPPDTTNSNRGVKINTAIRYAVQVITNIGNSGKRDLQFLGIELANNQDQNILNIAIENTGERILRPEVSLELFDEQGNSLGIFKADHRKTFPGTSITSSIVLEGIKQGNYNAVLVADCDEDHIFGTNFSLEI